MIAQQRIEISTCDKKQLQKKASPLLIILYIAPVFR